MADIRYTLEHSGDYVADVLEKAAEITVKAAGATWSATKFVAKKLSPDSISLRSVSGGSIKGALSGGSIKGALSKTTGFTWSMTKNVSGLARGSARGVIITYDINRLRKEKRALVRQLAERFLKVYTETSRPDLSYDADAAPILTRLSEIEKNLSAFLEERSERLYPKAAVTGETPAETHVETYVQTHVETHVETPAPETHAEEAVVTESPVEAYAEESVVTKSLVETYAEDAVLSEAVVPDAEAVASEEYHAGSESQVESESHAETESR